MAAIKVVGTITQAEIKYRLYSPLMDGTLSHSYRKYNVQKRIIKMYWLFNFFITGYGTSHFKSKLPNISVERHFFCHTAVFERQTTYIKTYYHLG